MDPSDKDGTGKTPVPSTTSRFPSIEQLLAESPKGIQYTDADKNAAPETIKAFLPAGTPEHGGTAQSSSSFQASFQNAMGGTRKKAAVSSSSGIKKIPAKASTGNVIPLDLSKRNTDEAQADRETIGANTPVGIPENAESIQSSSSVEALFGEAKENPLSISWHDSSWIPMLNTSNVMEYFSERTNPFYDRTCNNENLKMQRLGPEHLGNMIGLEYCLLHVQEPILYVIRKQHRHSPNQVTPISDYYILAGVVYQAPDLASVIGSRMLTMVHHLQSAFDEAASYSHYHPSKGYWWEFKDNEKIEKAKAKEEPGSAFQRRRVDVLLTELAKKFPPKLPSPPQLEKQTTEETAAVVVKVEPKVVDIKTEKEDTPPAMSTTTATAAPAIATPPTTTTTTSTTNASLPPPPPPPPPPAPIPTAQAVLQRNSMKPPPEKKPGMA